MASSGKTGTIGLNQWVATDPFQMSDFNADNAAVDSAVAALQNGKGNCNIEYGSYTGDGAYSKTLTASFQPKALLLTRQNAHASCYNQMLLLYGQSTYSTMSNSSSYYSSSVTWEGNSVTWVTKVNASDPCVLNEADDVYYYVFLG